jgi:hypothetical protein
MKDRSVAVDTDPEIERVFWGIPGIDEEIAARLEKFTEFDRANPLLVVCKVNLVSRSAANDREFGVYLLTRGKHNEKIVTGTHIKQREDRMGVYLALKGAKMVLRAMGAKEPKNIIHLEFNAMVES